MFDHFVALALKGLRHGYYFIKHVKFLLAKQINTSNAVKETLRLRLEEQQNFWIIKLELFAQKGQTQGLNHSLNHS